MPAEIFCRPDKQEHLSICRGLAGVPCQEVICRSLTKDCWGASGFGGSWDILRIQSSYEPWE